MGWLLLAGLGLLVASKRAGTLTGPNPLDAAPTVDQAAVADSPTTPQRTDPRPSDIAAGGDALYLGVDSSKLTPEHTNKDEALARQFSAASYGAQVVDLPGGALLTQAGGGAQVPAPGISYVGTSSTRRG